MKNTFNITSSYAQNNLFVTSISLDNYEDYRYGFQNQEVDNEIKGDGNSVNFKYRMHDPRIGRFFAVDPLAAKYPFYSPYAFSGNRVIDCKELEGLEPINAVGANGQPLFKQKAILTLPDATQVIIWNAQQGGRYIISRADMQRINSFNDQGYYAQPQIQAPQKTGIAPGTTEVQGTTYIDGATKPSDFPYNQFMSTTIQAPSQITINVLNQNPQSTTVQPNGVNIGNFGPINANARIPLTPANTNTQINNTIGMQPLTINNTITNLNNTVPANTARNITGVTIQINSNLTAAQQNQLTTGIGNTINGAPVTYQPVDLGNNLVTGQVTVNYTDTTPQQRQVPTLQIISQP